MMHKTADIEIKVLSQRLLELGGIPQRATEGAAAIDLRSCEENAVVLNPGCTHDFGTGFAIHIGDPNIAGFVLPRSGLGKRGLVLANIVGVIDSDYQGEIKCAARWMPENPEPITINPGDRIFQMVFLPVVLANLILVPEFSNRTARGEGGYGSTGI